MHLTQVHTICSNERLHQSTIHSDNLSEVHTPINLLANDINYSNSLLKDIHERHNYSLEIMNKFFTSTISTNGGIHFAKVTTIYCALVTFAP